MEMCEGIPDYNNSSKACKNQAELCVQHIKVFFPVFVCKSCSKGFKETEDYHKGSITIEPIGNNNESNIS